MQKNNEVKTQKLELCEIKIDKNGKGRFSGYAATFNNVDSYGDTLLPGAFADSLSDTWPKMFLNHDIWFSVPIGKWTEIKEDEAGLFVTGELTPDNTESDKAYAALKHGTLDGLSIGYRLKSDDYDYRTPGEDGYGEGRVIKKVSRLVEISLVTFPADDYARITAVKNGNLDLDQDLDEIKTERDFEYFLRDSGNFSKKQAMAILAKARSLYRIGDQSPEWDAKTLLDRINQLTQSL